MTLLLKIIESFSRSRLQGGFKNGSRQRKEAEFGAKNTSASLPRRLRLLQRFLYSPRPRLGLCGFTLFVFAFPSAALDLSKAVVVFPQNMSGPEKKAVTMMIEEADQRTRI